MDESIELFVSISLEDGDQSELDELTRQLRSEIEQLYIDSVNDVPAGEIPRGTKSADWAVVGQMVVTLAPTIIPPLFALLKSWVERKPSTPVKIKVRMGKKIAEIEYDPTKTAPKELESLVKTLEKSLKK